MHLPKKRPSFSIPPATPIDETKQSATNQYLPTSVIAAGHQPSLTELKNILPPLGNRGMSVYNELDEKEENRAGSRNHSAASELNEIEQQPLTANQVVDEKTPASSDAEKSERQKTSPLPRSRRQHRLLDRNSGRYNMLVINVPHHQLKLLSDLWTTLVDLPARHILILFLLSYFAVWTMFAFMYWMIAIFHEDVDNSSSKTACIANVHSLTTAFLFSFESQHTIGYGFRHITEQCLEAIVLLCLQSVIGVAIQAFMIGLIFTRIQRPSRARSQTLVFSRRACVCTRDGQMCLLFRVGNTRSSSLIIRSRVTAHLVHHRKTLEGELLPLHQHELIVQLDSMSSQSASTAHHLAWPMTACHVINHQSPLFDMDRSAMTEKGRFELIVTLEGVNESTGQIIQASNSYLPSEILWAYRFVPLLTYRRAVESSLSRKLSEAVGNSEADEEPNQQWSGKYAVDFKQFDCVERVDCYMSDSSAAQLGMLNLARSPIQS